MSISVVALARLLSVLAAAIPTALFVLIFWWLDRYEKEPKALLLGAFVWGAIPAAFLSLVLEGWLGLSLGVFSESVASVIGATLIAPPVEELAKGLALWGLYRWAHAEFDGTLDGIVYGAVVGLGFAMVENVFYFWSALEEGLAAWLTIIPMRSLAFGLNHALFTAFTGIGFARARYLKGRGQQFGAILAGLTLAVFVHLLHNTLASMGLCALSFIMNWMGVLALLAVVALSWRREAERMREYLQEEVSSGVLSAPLYEAIITRGQRYRTMLGRLQREGARRAQLFARLASMAAELAQKKHQLARMGEEKGNGATIARLRLNIAQLRAQLGE